MAGWRYNEKSMISFFRKIRFQLAADNQPASPAGRFFKYSRYAIGEIVLVVIGILIALQINNWNEDRKEELEERKILSNLHDEFNENLTNLKFKDSILQTTIVNLEVLFEELRSPETTFNGTSLDSILSRALNSPTWIPSEYVLNGLESSGNLTKLRNEHLKKLLFEWARFYSELDETQQMIETTNSQFIGYIKDNGSLRNVDVQNATFAYEKSLLVDNNEHLLSDPVFENYIDDKLYVLHNAKIQFKKAESIIISILRETQY